MKTQSARRVCVLLKTAIQIFDRIMPLGDFGRRKPDMVLRYHKPKEDVQEVFVVTKK
jgi:hypothetical protein